jgi:hypothetical protein
MRDDKELATVLRTQSLPELMIVKGLLDSVGIPYEVQGEVGLEMMPLRGVGPFGTRGSEAILRVHGRDQAAAMELIEAPAEFDEDLGEGED